jgi:hypothetical protein
MAFITLTQNQMNTIKRDLYRKTPRLTDREMLVLANQINDVINIPFVGEEKELIIFFRIIHWIDNLLYDLLPNEYYALIRSLENGITQEEANLIIKRLTPIINEAVNIPFVPEAIEGRIISIILSIIILAMTKGNKLQD